VRVCGLEKRGGSGPLWKIAVLAASAVLKSRQGPEGEVPGHREAGSLGKKKGGGEPELAGHALSYIPSERMKKDEVEGQTTRARGERLKKPRWIKKELRGGGRKGKRRRKPRGKKIVAALAANKKSNTAFKGKRHSEEGRRKSISETGSGRKKSKERGGWGGNKV